MSKYLFTKPTGFPAQMLVPVFEKHNLKSQHQHRQKNGVSIDVSHPALKATSLLKLSSSYMNIYFTQIHEAQEG